MKENQIMSRDVESGYIESELSSSKDSFEIELEELNNDPNKPTHSKPTSSQNAGHIRLDDNTYSNDQKSTVSKFLHKVWYGPDEPSDNPPNFTSPLLIKLEEYPRYYKNRFKRMSGLILVLYCFLWASLDYSILLPQFTMSPSLKGSNETIVTLSCTGQQYFWKGKNGKCGLNGELCTPFEDRDVIVKCPALCDRGGWTYSATPVGDEMVKYTGYTIGGGSKEPDNEDKDTLTYPYRADSFPCGSAVHAGVLSPFFGGCVKVSFVGSQLSFNSTMGHYGTDFSVPFPSFFPSSFVFKNLPNGLSGCYDWRLLILFTNIILGAPVVYLADGLVSYWIVNLVGYWTILLSLDPPVIVDPEDPESVATLFSIGFQRLLPLCFVLYTLWKICTKRTFTEPTSPVVKLFLWYPLFWLGVANNLTFDRLPVDRLTPKDLKEQPGGLIAVLSIFSTIITCAVIQAYKLWKSGRFQKYFKIYITFIISILVFAMLPGLSLRIHHYILALVLIPGCATKGFSAFMFQGVLLGLFLSGIARWDFASILETERCLLREEAGGSLEPPTFNNYTDGLVSWTDHNETAVIIKGEPKSPHDQLFGYSLVINDIERYVGNQTKIYIDELINENQDFKDLVEESLEKNADSNGDITLFLRLGKSTIDSHRDTRGDYTRAATLKWPSGNWTAPCEGLS